MRNLIAKYGTPIGLSVLLLAGLIYWIRSRSGTPNQNQITQAFFIDEETGEESIENLSAIPPLIGKSGKPTVVRIMKYSCDGGRTKIPLFYAKYPADTQAALKNLPARKDLADIRRSDLLARGELYRLPAAGSPWVSSLSEQGMTIAKVPDCNGKPAKIVYP